MKEGSFHPHAHSLFLFSTTDSSANSLVQPTLLIVELAEFSKCVPPNSLDVYLKKVAASKDILRRVASVLDNVESRIAFMNNRYVQSDAAHAPPYAEKLKNVIQELGMNSCAFHEPFTCLFVSLVC